MGDWSFFALTSKPLDRWLGGTHVTNDNRWRWEPATASLLRA